MVIADRPIAASVIDTPAVEEPPWLADFLADVGGPGDLEGLPYQPRSKRRRKDSAKAAKAKKPSRRRRWARKGSWLNAPANGYVHIAQHYGQSDKRADCLTLWDFEARTVEGVEQTRYRGQGCSDRDFCPTCTVYYRDSLAQQAKVDVLEALAGAFEVYGLPVGKWRMPEGRLKHNFGTKLVLTMPKVTSAWIDSQNEDKRADLLAAQFKATSEFCRRTWGKGIGAVMGQDFAGETEPTEAHYHSNVYILPMIRRHVSVKKGANKAPGEWAYLDTFVEPSKLKELRQSWAAELRRQLPDDAPGLSEAELPEGGVLWLQPLISEAALAHWLQYLYRSPLFDLWKGWSGVDGDGQVQYKYSKLERVKGAQPKRKSYTVNLSASGVQQACRRVDRLPRNWKSVRWVGYMSDSRRADCLGEIGMEKVPKEELVAEEQWVHQETFRRVKYEGTGILLESLRTLERVFVDDKQIDYRPSKVNLGKHKTWRPAAWRMWVNDEGTSEYTE